MVIYSSWTKKYERHQELSTKHPPCHSSLITKLTMGRHMQMQDVASSIFFATKGSQMTEFRPAHVPLSLPIKRMSRATHSKHEATNTHMKANMLNTPNQKGRKYLGPALSTAVPGYLLQNLWSYGKEGEAYLLSSLKFGFLLLLHT